VAGRNCSAGDRRDSHGLDASIGQPCIGRVDELPGLVEVPVPPLWAEGYHSELFSTIGMSGKAAATARMLDRLAAAVDAELMAAESIERRADENRQVRHGVAVGFESAVARGGIGERPQ
jgi:hypothetical protein